MESKITFEVLDESGHDGADVKENVLTDGRKMWRSARTGLPCWISFNLLAPTTVKTLKFRNDQGCNTSPMDMVLYGSDDAKTWTEIRKNTRNILPGSDWHFIELNCTNQYFKIEILNNQNKTTNESWSLYTYMYEVVFVKAQLNKLIEANL